MKETPYDRVARELKRLKLSDRRASLTITDGRSADAVRNMKRGRSYMPKEPDLSRLGSLIGKTTEWILGDDDAEAPAMAALPLGMVRVPFRARLQAGVWAEHAADEVTGLDDLLLPERMVPRGIEAYAAELVGESMNRLYPSGSIILLERRFDRREDLIPGRRYHVERQKADGAIESTLKTVLRRADGSIWLVPESDDPAFQAPIRLENSIADGVSFVGRVFAAVIKS
ncbi:S24 family peptidase [Prosthecomicrobium hirschii]|uniref:Peptidase S24/S26A/S26B/S26C domain-containing protein n=1 Tax=Prosthecodimorpha hirschii TaxID=665126 RepID=A0A0P6WGI9_9HYPH|nr:S24 family peptidase [Prosthecomicrobium hirschii]KPL55548.1 hypothetical protein ABB55_27680 [Prosthecomicrobium hirschii]MCW1839464.1 S24 family peptidase [Prosthecomicrobium hirschii]